MVTFSPSPRHTVGVEWELQLLDSETLDLTDGIMPLLEFFPDTDFVKPEFVQSCVELNTRVCENSTEAVANLAETLGALLTRSAKLEMNVSGAGTHPFCRRLALITPLPRYLAMEQESGYAAHTQITFSTRVHVGMQSGDQAMRVMSQLIPALPVFVALSANSPFWRGHMTGHAAYRQRILAAARNYGLPQRFRSWDEFNRFLTVSRRAGLLETFKDIHWHIRPHSDFGTLELRAMDSGSSLESVHGLVAFARCLMVKLANSDDKHIDGILPGQLPDWFEQQNCFNAALHGLDARLVVREDGAVRPIREVARDLLEFCGSADGAYQEADALAFSRQLLDGAPQYQQHRQAYRPKKSARAVAESLVGGLQASVPQPGIQED